MSVFMSLFILFAANGGLHFQFQSEKEWRSHSTDLKSNPRKVHHKTQTTSDQKDDMDLLIGINNKELNLTGTRVYFFYVFCMRHNW